jgi:RNA polymerase sigma-70 factor (ECF subfamily)
VDHADIREADVALMLAVAAGDTDAYRQLFRQFAPELYSLAIRIVGTRSDAEDVLSEVFLELWRYRERYDAERSSLRTYLILMTRSRAIDALRARNTRPRPIEPFLDISSDGISQRPSHVAELQELQCCMRTAMQELSSPQKTTLELSFYNGLSHTEISARLDMPLGTVKSHIRKGLAMLKRSLRQFDCKDQRT